MPFLTTGVVFRARLASLMVMGLSVWLDNACAMSRIGEAEVRLQDGQPCFTISDKEAKRGPSFLLQAVILSDSSTKPVNTVWSMAPDLASSLKMSPANCVVYGQILDGATASPASAPALRAGRVYRVYLNTRSSDSSDPTRGQDASFCLVADQTGDRRLVQVRYGMRAWDTGYCE